MCWWNTAALIITQTRIPCTVQALYAFANSSLFACVLLLGTGYSTVHRVVSRVSAVVLFTMLTVYTLTTIACRFATEMVSESVRWWCSC